MTPELALLHWGAGSNSGYAFELRVTAVYVIHDFRALGKMP